MSASTLSEIECPSGNEMKPIVIVYCHSRVIARVPIVTAKMPRGNRIALEWDDNAHKIMNSIEDKSKEITNSTKDIE